MSPSAVVIISERLGPLGEPEARIEQETAATVHVEPLATEDLLIGAGARADVLVVGAVEPVNERVLGSLARTWLIVRRGVGIDNVDVAAATANGIPVAYVPDASVEEVSDHAVVLALALERRIVDAAHATRAGDVASAGAAVARARRFSELRVGVVGLGRIGRATARKLVPLVGRVHGYDPTMDTDAAADLGIEFVELDELFAHSDIVTLHVPLNPETRMMVDERRLRLMPAGGSVVNTARGELVDERALLRVVHDGHLAGAALDVTTREPLPADHPLLDEPRVLLTGHTAAKGRRSSQRLRDEVVGAVIDGLNGLAPKHLADSSVLESAVRPLRLRNQD